MNTKNTTRFLSIVVLFTFLLTACGAQPAPAAVPTLTISEMQTLVANEARPAVDGPACTSDPAEAARIGQSLTAEELLAWIEKCNTAVQARLDPPATPTNAAPTSTLASPTVVDPTQPVVADLFCEDGKLVVVYNAPAGTVLDRTPLGEAERADILEISYEGEGLGFGSHARAIIVIPRLGNVWMVDAKAGSDTIMTRGFCGTNEAVADWAIKAHIPSLQAASRDSNGDQPPAAEIAVYRLDFETRAFIVEHAATAANAPTPEEVLSWIEVMFNENGHASSVPMHVER